MAAITPDSRKPRAVMPVNTEEIPADHPAAVAVADQRKHVPIRHLGRRLSHCSDRVGHEE
ncbi:MAG: hypothetical protein H0W14_13610 [Actinobacteria bacterium]|nr:hypothetical protein [Actinomycetota bacterium]